MSRLPIAFIPKRFVFQPIDVTEVAVRLGELIDSRPTGLQLDIAGPEIHTAEHLARTLMEATGKERPMINLPLLGAAARAFAEGVHTNPDRTVGEIT